MEVADIVRVVEAWTAEYVDLGSRPEIRHVQIFENRGAMMGASNPHPHGQIWATEHIPDEPAAELANQLAYHRQHNACLLCDTLRVELEQRHRVVCENQEFVAIVPFWAVWPFETMVLSRAHLASMDAFSAAQQHGLADILHRLTMGYDQLFSTSFPYTMGFHQRPTDGEAHPEWHFHGHFYPPLLRSATVRKFMVGFEMLGMPQRDITPETAAEQLRAVAAKGSR
jgi:UDPglucose--hexose-1-phosphate uridylyltransferase